MEDRIKASFIADVIKALEDAEIASQASPKPIDKDSLAKEAYHKLHFDYPLVSVHEVRALIEAFQAHQSWSRVSTRFLDVLYDTISNINMHGGCANESAPLPTQLKIADSNTDDELLASLQKLYATSILHTIIRACNLGSDAKNALLGDYNPAPCSTSVPLVNELISDTVIENKLTPEDNDGNIAQQTLDGNDDDDDDLEYESLDMNGSATTTSPSSIDASTTHHDSEANIMSVEQKLNHLAQRLTNYQFLASHGVWQDGTVVEAVQRALALVTTQHLFLLSTASSLCTLLHDRIASSPNELDRVMKALVDGMGLESEAFKKKLDGSGVDSSVVAIVYIALRTIASLCLRLPARSPSRNKLWICIRDRWLDVVGQVLERIEGKQRQLERKQQQSSSDTADFDDEHLRTVLAASYIIEFYAIDAPVASKKDVHDGLIASGALQGIVLSFIRFGHDRRAEPLRRTMLVCCAVSSKTRSWAIAVPGFSSVWEERKEDELSGLLPRHVAAYASLTGAQDGDALLARAIISQDVLLQPENVPELHSTLLLMDAIHRACCEVPPPPVGPQTDTALLAASAGLRDMQSNFGVPDRETTGQSISDEAKLEASQEDQAAILAVRRARLLQAESLRMIKSLRSKPGSTEMACNAICLNKPVVANKAFTGARVAAKSTRVVARVARRVECSANKKEAVVAGVTVAVATMMANPLVAEAAVSPSLKNLLNSVVAGGVVLAAIAGAVTAVSSFDSIERK